MEKILLNMNFNFDDFTKRSTHDTCIRFIAHTYSTVVLIVRIFEPYPS